MWSVLTRANELPVNISMKNFASLRKSDTTWYSDPFYTHLHGYKMCLRVDANGYDSSHGTHVSAFINLMRGEFDDKLNWPFRGKLQIELLNLSGDENIERTLVFEAKTPDRSAQRVTDGEMASSGWGFYSIIAHSKLEAPEADFLYNDSLTFRVTLLKLGSST